MAKTIFMHDILEVLDNYTRIALYKRVDWKGSGKGCRTVLIGRYHAYQMHNVPNWPVVRMYHNHLTDEIEIWYEGGTENEIH